MRKKRVKNPPMMILLPPSAVASDSGLARMFIAQDRWTRHQVRMLLGMYGFKSNERQFARDLLNRYPHVFLYRCHQQKGCGDFMLATPERSVDGQPHVYGIELKRGGRLKINRGAGFQMRNVGDAVGWLSECGVVTADVPVTTIVGDKDEVLSWLGQAAVPVGDTELLGHALHAFA